MVLDFSYFQRALRRLGLGRFARSEEPGRAVPSEESDRFAHFEEPVRVVPSAESLSTPQMASAESDSGVDVIPIENLPIGIFNALKVGISSVVTRLVSMRSFVTSEATYRANAIRSESANEFGKLRRFIAKIVCGGVR